MMLSLLLLLGVCWAAAAAVAAAAAAAAVLASVVDFVDACSQEDRRQVELEIQLFFVGSFLVLCS